jgi:hypothetical protein
MGKSRYNYFVDIRESDGTISPCGIYGSKKAAETAMRRVRNALNHNKAEADVLLSVVETDASLRARFEAGTLKEYGKGTFKFKSSSQSPRG